ncbi:hypothetical protein CHS0354_025643 [Potamilus streckersoni]|uniref:Ashwin n=1 Tax=Potamilus streckersoni TaxID=2493646 RepID=A0AAE0RYG3_9BIVA|nr:hypothetical protein CHS0354_025643 [Potamilus streckersoni]
MEEKESKSPSCDLLYPEILSHSDIVNLFKQRCIKVDGLEKLEKHKLVELFYRYILPLPQRKYRLNRRGRLMTKNQIQLAKKRKLSSTTTQDEGEPVLKKKSSGLLNSFDLGSSSSERIKNPVTCINMERKTIKLGSSKRDLSKTSLSSSVSNIKLTSDSSKKETEDTKERKKTIKPVSISDSDTKANLDKTISNINKHLSSSTTGKGKCKTEERNHVSEKSPSSVESETKMDTSPAVLCNKNQETEDAKSSPKKKFKMSKISWP